MMEVLGVKDWTWGNGDEFMTLLDLHRYPVGDLREHEMSHACWCRPYLDWERDSVFIWRHMAKDCREFVDPEWDDLIFYAQLSRFRTELTKAAGEH